MSGIYLTPSAGLVDRILDGIRSKVDIAVVGLSGGADSTLVATLSALALGKENVYGASMPYGETDLKTFNNRSQSLAAKLGIKHNVYPIRQASNGVSANFPALSTLNAGNLRSRMRMVHLYTHACQIAEANPDKRVRVMGTGNLSEDFIGYDTKGGDALADYFPIGQLYKKEVYAFLDYFKDLGVIDDEHIDRVPSAGLWEGQTDEAELGYSYDQMAPAIHVCLMMKNQGRKPGDPEFTFSADPEFKKLVEFVWNRHWANKHKHEGPEALDLGR